MSNDFVDRNKLNRECNIFCKYLIHQKPNNYVVEKYHDAHIRGSISKLIGFDNFLNNIASISPFFTKLSDVYTSIYLKRSAFRRKLILLIAILESCPPTCNCFDLTTASYKPVIFLKMSAKMLFFIFSILLTTIIFLPLQIIYRIISK